MGRRTAFSRREGKKSAGAIDSVVTFQAAAGVHLRKGPGIVMGFAAEMEAGPAMAGCAALDNWPAGLDCKKTDAQALRKCALELIPA